MEVILLFVSETSRRPSVWLACILFAQLCRLNISRKDARGGVVGGLPPEWGPALCLSVWSGGCNSEHCCMEKTEHCFLSAEKRVFLLRDPETLWLRSSKSWTRSPSFCPLGPGHRVAQATDLPQRYRARMWRGAPGWCVRGEHLEVLGLRALEVFIYYFFF